MITTLSLIVLGFLILVSILDIKYKAIPSVFSSAMLFAVLLLRPDNLIYGVLCLVFAIMIRDLLDDVAGMSFGLADIKILIIMGLLLTNFSSLMLMIFSFLFFQFAYTFLWKWKIKNEEEIPFIPCLLAVYITLLIVGVVA